MEKTISNEYEGLYHSYFKRINNEVKETRESYEYEKRSQAFAHWYLNNIEGININTVEESITDGHNDWGVDAVVVDEDENIIKLYQFKFPEKEQNISKKVTQEEIASFLRGYSFCSSGKVPTNANDELKMKVAEIKDSNIYNFKLNYISYTDGLSETARITLETELEKIESTGNRVEWSLLDKRNITDLVYNQSRIRDDYEITLSQYGTSTGVYMDESSETYIVYASLLELANICEEHNDIIFDENVRLFEGTKNKFNTGIIETASGGEVGNFHLYNNGVVIVSPDVTNLDLRKRIKIKNPMVVNGCQTMNSLLEANKRGELKDGVVQVTIIEVTDPVIKQNISIFLNSQTEIKDSYLISNLPIVRALEEDLEDLGYFFERQANNLELLKDRLSRKEKAELLGISNSKAIGLDFAIQLQASFYENLAPVAKLNKSKLFEKKNIEKILKNINAERVAFAFEIYNKVMERIKDYRSFRRNNNNMSILTYLGVSSEESDEYLFLNTGDLFLISTLSEVSQRKYGKLPDIEEKNTFNFEDWKKSVEDNFDSLFKKSINIMKECMSEDITGKQVATLTKNQAFHKELMRKVNELQIAEQDKRKER